MSVLFSRGIILGFSRTINYAVQFLSPIILVRILDVTAYGQFREFLLYAMFAVTIISFSIKGNLLYFIPRDAAKERLYVTNSVLMLFVSSLLGLLVLLFAKSWLIKNSSFNFIGLLAVYVLFYVNLDIVESFWLSKKRSDYVLKYSTTLVVARLLSVVFAAYWSRDVLFVIYAMIAVEIAKTVAILVWLVSGNKLSVSLNPDVLKEQFVFVFPLWISAIVFFLNQELGKFYTSVNLGVVALALYAIGGYPVPILSALRTSVTDVILPNMAERNHSRNGDSLDLWRKSNILFCLITFPIFTVLIYHAEYLIKVGFTEQYTAAAGIFRIYAISMIMHSFEMSTPLKAINANRFFVAGNFIGLLVNIAMLHIMTAYFGLVGPALALLAAELAMYIYTGKKIADEFNIAIRSLFKWASVIRIALASALGVPIFVLCGTAISTPSLSFALSVCLFGLTYIVAIRQMNIYEANWLFQKLQNVLRHRSQTRT